VVTLSVTNRTLSVQVKKMGFTEKEIGKFVKDILRKIIRGKGKDGQRIMDGNRHVQLGIVLKGLGYEKAADKIVLSMLNAGFIEQVTDVVYEITQKAIEFINSSKPIAKEPREVKTKSKKEVLLEKFQELRKQEIKLYQNFGISVRKNHSKRAKIQNQLIALEKKEKHLKS